jgi:uncharacterized protein YgiM (DUF1202 family)
MEAIIKAIQSTQIPKLLIVVGLFIVVLAFLTKIGGVIEVSQEQRRWAIPVGIFLLVLGLILHLSTDTTPHTDTTPQHVISPKCKIIVNDPNPPLNVRESPNGKIIGTIQNGEILTVKQNKVKWLVIDYQGRDGYVNSKLTKSDCN